MKKKLSVLLCLCMAFTSLAGCSGNNEPSSSEESNEFVPSMDKETVAEINVGGNWSNFQALEAAAADWNQIYPNVTVNYTQINDYTQMLNTIVTGTNPPDIITLDADGYYENKDVIINALEDLSEIGMNTDVLGESVIGGSSANGKFCTLSWGTLAAGFVVNDSLLEELGLSIPNTQEEFNQVCDALVEKGYVPIQGCYIDIYSNLMNNDSKYRIVSSGSYNEAYDKSTVNENGRGSVFAPEFSRLIEMVEKGYISADINDSIPDIYESAILHFFEGQTPFLCITSETFSGMKKRESKSEYFTEHPFTYEFVSLPVNSDEPVLSVSYLQGLGVVSAGKNVEWANEFMRFLCSEEELNKMAEVKGVPGVTKADTNDERFAHIDAIPEDKQVGPVLDEFAKLVDESFAYTLEKIARGEITTVEAAEKYFETHLEDIGG